MRIYRIQRKHREAICNQLMNVPMLGLYYSQVSRDMHEMSGRHPSPWDDSKLGRAMESVSAYKANPNNFFFGFATLDQMRSWVYKDSWREELDAENFEIVAIDASVVLVGDTQAMFDASREWGIVGTMQVTEL